MRIKQKTNKKSKDEKRILIGMIVDDIVLGRISSKWENNMFRSRWANLISSWCISFYKKYNKAPRKNIEQLYNKWSNKTKDENTIVIVGKFLGTLSEDYEELQEESNSDYILDMAGEYFNTVRMEQLIDKVQTEMDNESPEEAHRIISSYAQVEMGVGKGIDVLHDKEAIKEAFKSKEEPLITYTGPLGKFFSDAFERDGFISFMGPEKRGKSFWLMEIAYKAMIQRRRVAFFEAGDMSQNQIMRRLMTRVARRPLFAGNIKYPLHIKRIGDGNDVKIRTKTRMYRHRLSWRYAVKSCRRLMIKKIRSRNESYFRLSCHPNSSLSVSGIMSILQDWEREEWIPDVIVVDYADILNMDHPALEGRDRINATWKQLRALSQMYHCLVVTATQADSASYLRPTIDMTNFSEDKRKMSHVTGMIGINATASEKERGIMRLNWIVRREGAYSTRQCVFTAGCLSIANPAVRSCL